MSAGRGEKELTAQEAIALAQEELSPFWFGSEPLLIGLDQGGQVQVFPLERDFSKQLWLIIVVDPASFWGDSVFDIVQELESRYRVLGLNILVIYSVKYQFQKSPNAARKWVPEKKTTSVQCFDVNCHLAAGFRAVELPKVLLFKEGVRLFETSSKGWVAEADEQIQKALRMTEPGLPLAPVISIVDGVIYDTSSVNFNSSSLAIPGFKLLGNWHHDHEKVWTDDPAAQLSFISPASEVSILARPKEDLEAVPHFLVELMGQPPYDAVRGGSLRVSENSELIVQVKDAKFYSLLTGLPVNERGVSLRFENVKQCPIEIYGLRFGEKMKARS